MNRAHAGVGMLALSVLLASCGRVSRDAPDAGPNVASGGSANDSGPGDASASTAGAESSDAAASGGPSPCDAANVGTVTWATTFETRANDAAFASGAPEGLTPCGDGLCLLENSGLLLKLTAKGTVVWSRNVGGQSSADRFVTMSLAADASGRLTVGGYCTGQPMLTAPTGMEPLLGCGVDSNHPEVVVARFDASGLFVSGQTLGTSEDYPPPIAVAAEPDGRSAVFALAGGPPNLYQSNGLVIAWAADGTESYRHLFVGGAPRPADIAFDSKGNAVIVGFFGPTKSEEANSPDAGVPLDTAGSEICVVKLSPQGELSWSRCFGGDGQADLDPALGLAPDDSIFLSGTFVGQLDFDAIGKDAAPSPTRLTTVGPSNIGTTEQPDFDLYVAKLTADGEFAWQRGFGNRLDQDGPYGLAITPEGRVILDATTRGALDIGPFHVAADSSGSGFILELDGSGEPSFLIPLSGTQYLTARRGIALGNCRDFYASGHFEGNLQLPGITGFGDTFLVAGPY